MHDFAIPIPSDKSLGYRQMPLRGKDSAPDSNLRVATGQAAGGLSRPAALAAAGPFLAARRVWGLVFTPSMVADSGRLYKRKNRASLREVGQGISS